MTKVHHSTSIVILLTLGCLCAPIYSQCVTFYTDNNLQGASFQLCGSGNVPAQYNDQVSSFVVPTGYTVTLYRDYGYGGPSIGAYGAGTYNSMANGWNDQLSSVTIAAALNPNCLTLYTDNSLQGNVFQLCSSGNVPAQYNDQVSSFVVPTGYTVTLYRDYGYGGPSSGPYGAGTYNSMANGWNDQLSSVTIAAALNPNCVTFYTDNNLQGNVFQLCSSGNVPAQYNDQVSSFVVPAGYIVTLYRDYGYGGPSIGAYGAGTYNSMASGWNDQLSSVVIGPACVTFYTDNNLQGNAFQLCSSGNVPTQYNDQVSSFVVPAGVSVTLYRDYGYGGPSIGAYGAGTYNSMANGWNDQLSSAKLVIG